MSSQIHLSRLFECNFCRESFATKDALVQHYHSSHSRTVCSGCIYWTAIIADLKQHLSSTGHTGVFACENCTRVYLCPGPYNRHLQRKHISREDAGGGLASAGCNGEASCADCNMRFTAKRILKEHLQSFGHIAKHRCDSCMKFFNTEGDLESHLGTSVHQLRLQKLPQPIPAAQPIRTSEFRCLDCDRAFKNQNALNDHLLHKKVHKRPEPKLPATPNLDNAAQSSLISLSEPICGDCGKKFKSKQALIDHQASNVHKSIINSLKCIGGNGCDKTFDSPSAMIMHLESGACPSNLSRKRINELIVKHDTTNMITTAGASYEIEKLLEMEDTESISSSAFTSDDDDVFTLGGSDSEGCTLQNVHEYTFLARPSASASGSGSTSNEQFTAPTRSTINETTTSAGPLISRRHPLACPLCPPTRKPFGSAEALRMHTESPVHAPKIYRCPDFLFDSQDSGSNSKKQKEFVSLSGLAKHLEDGSCQGGKKTFEKAISFVTGRLAGMGQSDVRLIE